MWGAPYFISLTEGVNVPPSQKEQQTERHDGHAGDEALDGQAVFAAFFSSAMISVS